MPARGVILGLLFCTLLAIGMVQFALLYQSERLGYSTSPIQPHHSATTTDNQLVPPVVDFDAERVYTYYDYTTLKLIVFGSIWLPTPCHQLRIESEVQVGAPELVDIRLYSTQSAESCTQMVIQAPFATEIEPISAVAALRFFHNDETWLETPPIQIQDFARYEQLRLAHTQFFSL